MATAQLTPDELPEVLLDRPGPRQHRKSRRHVRRRRRSSPAAPDDKAPRWFTAMDANRDGAISRREFLGPAEKFAELDHDRNGLLELSEAARH